MTDKILDTYCRFQLISNSTLISFERRYSSNYSNKLRCFLQLQAEQLAAITWAQITYIVPFFGARKQVVQTAETPMPLSPDILAELRSKTWAKKLPVKGAEFSLIIPRSITSI